MNKMETIKTNQTISENELGSGWAKVDKRERGERGRKEKRKNIITFVVSHI